VKPHVAVFGRKDFQQLQVIRRMVRDLDLEVEILGGAIVREPDGVALSSRNAYLSADQRDQAVCLSQSLGLAQERVTAGPVGAAELLELVRAFIGSHHLAVVDYIELVDAEELLPVAGVVTGPSLLALAVRFGHTRLIDNRVIRV
jgi:pantoate--beta-alanine ligase